jgi:hypothetical protein
MHVRQLVKVGEGKTVPVIVGGEAAITLLVENVLGIGAGSTGDKDVRHVIKEFRVGIPGTEEQTMRKGALQLKLAGVVNGVSVIGARGYTPAKIRVSKEGMHVRVNEEMLSTSTDICAGKQKTAGELPLDVEIPLMGERVQKMGVHCGKSSRCNCAKTLLNWIWSRPDVQELN